MKVTMVLADWAEAINGKLYIMGGGWSITGPDPLPSALAIKIEVPWDETNRPHTLRLGLIDDDGQPVVIAGGEKPFEITGRFELGRPSGLPPGTPMDTVLAVSLAPMPLERGKRYIWRLWIDDESNDDWQTAFMVRRGEPQPGRPLG
jgi:hypothetical protein